jgi:hypothetical protein
MLVPTPCAVRTPISVASLGRVFVDGLTLHQMTCPVAHVALFVLPWSDSSELQMCGFVVGHQRFVSTIFETGRSVLSMQPPNDADSGGLCVSDSLNASEKAVLQASLQLR